MEQKPEPEKICTECGHKLPANYFDNSDKCYLCDVEPTNKPEAPMTWEQLLAKFCEQNFDTSYKKAMREKSPVVMAEIYKAAADFHAREAFNRGAREQREICYNNREPLYLCSEDYYQKFDEIAARVLLNAPAPEFKA